METNFNDAERAFVANGGHLWCVCKVPQDGWQFVRWSSKGRQAIGDHVATLASAWAQLYDYVRPTSLRARTALHHTVPRLGARARHFPLL